MFQVPNGIYPFTVTPVPGFIPTPANGSATVAGHSVLVPIAFDPAPVYPLIFSESGLPPGSAWYVTLDYTSSPTTNSSHTFWLSNGTYPYLVGPGYADGGIWDAKPSNGTAVIHGEGISVPVRFYPAEWWATFTETGLPEGTWWTVNITVDGNVSEGGGTSAESNIFLLPNGTYGFVIGKVSGYSTSSSEGSFTISGRAFNVTIQFVASTPSAPEPPVEKGGPRITESWSKVALVANAEAKKSLPFTRHA